VAIAGWLGGFVTWLLPGRHSLAMSLVAAAIAVVPAMCVEAWYKRRDRHRAERLFVLPEYRSMSTQVVRHQST
jgi:hypothetical protein